MSQLIPVTGWYALYMGNDGELFTGKIDYIEVVGGDTQFVSLDEFGGLNDPSSCENWVGSFNINGFLENPVELVEFLEEEKADFKKRKMEG